MKKTFAAAAITGFVVLAGASAANAQAYPSEITCVASPASIVVGATSTITCEVPEIGATEATFTVSPTSGATLSSIVAAPVGVQKPISGGSTSATLTGNAPGTYTVTVTAAGEGVLTGTSTVTVTDGSTGGAGTIPSTGGEIPVVALWVGAGALGLGGLAVVAATARRRAQR